MNDKSSGNILSGSFILTQCEIENAPLDLIKRQKNEWDEKFMIARRVREQNDGRSYCGHTTDWQESSPSEGLRQFTKTVYLCLTNPEDVRTPDDLVWMPPCPSTAHRTEHITRNGKVLCPIGKLGIIWRMRKEEA